MASFNQLPNELVSQIISFVKYPTLIDETHRFPDQVSKQEGISQLMLCCLVCRRWLAFAQPLLFEQVALYGSPAPILLRQSLTRSNKLARYVRELRVWIPLELQDLLDAAKLLEDCLELTTELEKLVITTRPSSAVTNDIVRRICRLSNLKSFTLHISDNHSPTSNFEPELFLELPRTIEELEFEGISQDLLRLLPQICAKLQPSPSTTQRIFSTSIDKLVRCGQLLQNAPADCTRRLSKTDAEAFQLLVGKVEEMTNDIVHHTPTTEQKELSVLSSGIEEQRTLVTPLTGLRALSLKITQEYPASLLTEIGHSTPMLTSLSLELSSHNSKSYGSDLVDCLLATPLLEHLRLTVRPCQVLFDILPRMSQLKSLGIFLEVSGGHSNEDGFPMPPRDEDGFLPSIARFISHCNHLETFEFGNCYYDWVDLSRLIDVVIKSTTNSMAISTLRSLEITTMSELPIEALEHLCQSAPLLQKLKIWIDCDYRVRCARALEKLEHLDTAELQIHLIYEHFSGVRHFGGDPIDFSSML